MEVKILGTIISDTIDNNYKKHQKKTIRERYKGISKGYYRILNFMEITYYDKAKQYYIKRTKGDKKLKKIQSKSLKEITKCINNPMCHTKQKINYKLIPASSFSAKTNLIGESDLDILLLVKRITDDDSICLSNALGMCDYGLSCVRNSENKDTKHWVFQKYIDKVEIECKLRSYEGFKEILKMHQYTDFGMTQKEKILATYTKYLLKKYSPKNYEKFKMIYYCNAGYHGKTKKLLYPLL
jgi:hypothetical protein